LLSLGWFLFAENKPAEAAKQFDAAEKAGADVKTARELLAFISKGALEIEAEKLLSRLRALVQNRQWQQAQSELRTIQRQYAQTFAIQSAQQELANIEATLAASQLATAVGAQFKPGSEVKIFEGHTSTVVSVAMSEDLKWVLTGSNDGTARLWEAASGKQLHLFRLTSDRSTTNAKAVALTPDGRLSIVLGSDSTLRVWDNQTGEQRLTVPMAGQHCMAVHPDGKRVLTGGSNNTLKLWDIRADKLERELNTRGTPGTCGFSADGRIVFSTHHDGTLRLWETDTGRELKVLQAGPSSTLVNGALSPDARYAVTWGWSSKTIKLWDLSSDTMIGEMLANSDAVTTAVFSRDGRFLISGGRDNSVRLLAVATGSNLLTMGAHRGPVHSVAVSADGRFAVSGSNDGTARLWMLWGEGGASPQAVALAKARAPRVIGEFRYAVRALDLTPDGRYALGGSTDSSSGIKIWEIATGREVRVIKSGGVTAAAFSPDGRFIISGGGDGLLTLWDANTGASLRIFKGFSDTINDLKFTPDGRFVLGCSFGKLVRVWDTQSTNVVASYSGHSDMVISLAVSPDGKTAASASKDKTVRLWEIATGKELQVIRGHGDQVWCVAFSPNGRLIASGGADNAVHIRDANNGALLHRMEGHGLTVRSVAFSPDSRYVLSGSVDKTLRLWEVATGKLLKTFEGSAGVINRVKFSPDGRFAVSGGEDKNVMVWNLFDAPLPTSPPPTSSSPTPPSPAPSAVDTTRMPDGNFVKPKRERTPQTFLKVVSKQGDFIGQGKDYVYGEQELNVSGNDQNILARAGGWRLNIAPPPNQALKVGEYLGAKRTAFRGDAPGIDFGGNGRGSNKIEGRFVIWELEVVSGQITRLALDFVQHSENANAPPLFGSLRFNSNYGDDPEKTTSAPLLPFIPQPNIQRPPAPPSAPAANTDEELRQRVFALVRQLDTGLQTGSGRIAENDLVRIGAPALPHLREAANSSPFPMHKSRIESVIQKIEGNLDATTPTAPDAALPQFWLSEIGVTVSLYQNRALLIHDVQSNSIAAAIGLRTGDIISHINDQPTKTHEEFQKLFAEGLQQLKERDAPVRFRVMRGAGIFKPSWRGK
jgi:WD40 repeat protein